MKSMTGYGRGSTINDRFSAAVEIKTVNNRFLDVNTKSNQELSSYEVVIKQQIASRLKRGRVDVMITIFRRDEVNYELNRSLAAGFLSVIQEIKDEFELKGEPDINQLIRLPGVMLAARDVVSDYLKPYIDQALAKALDEVEMMRGKEGQALANDCLVRLAKLDLLMTRIEDVAAAQPDGYQLRLSKRITELIERMRSEQKIIELDESRLAQEVAYLAERSDINEEIARLRSHTEQFHGILNSDGEHGKRLDFLLQEFNREANTILSKATDLVIKNAALEIKGEIEKMREQVQNIE